MSWEVLRGPFLGACNSTGPRKLGSASSNVFAKLSAFFGSWQCQTTARSPQVDMQKDYEAVVAQTDEVLTKMRTVFADVDRDVEKVAQGVLEKGCVLSM